MDQYKVTVIALSAKIIYNYIFKTKCQITLAALVTLSCCNKHLRRFEGFIIDQFKLDRFFIISEDFFPSLFVVLLVTKFWSWSLNESLLFIIIFSVTAIFLHGVFSLPELAIITKLLVTCAFASKVEFHAVLLIITNILAYESYSFVGNHQEFLLFLILSFVFFSLFNVLGIYRFIQFTIQLVLSDIGTVLIWLALSSIAGCVFLFGKYLPWSKTTRRKIFHLLAGAIYVHGLLFYKLALLKHASLCLILMFLAMQIMILVVDSPQLINTLEIFADEKDRYLPSGKRIFITPITLLMALCVPLFMSETLDFQFAGVIAIAVGDSFSAVIGSKYGKNRWSKSSNKTIEGSTASFLAQQLFCYLIIGRVGSSFLPVIISTIMEASTNQIDNLLVPLYYLLFL